jgi:hypothetical protein
LAADPGAAVPPTLVGATVKAAAAIAAGNKAAFGAISASAVALAEGVVKAMLQSKLKVGGELILAVATLGAAGTAGLGYRAGAGEQDQLAKQIVPNREMPVYAMDNHSRAPGDEAEKLQQELAQVRANLAVAPKNVEDLEARLKLIKRRELEPPKSIAIKSLGGWFKYFVSVEINVSQFKDGGRLEMLEVWGTRTKIEVGGQYVTSGKYVLPKDGTLYFFYSATGGTGLVSIDTPAC